ncbi:MAG: MFS transporter [Anaerolineales bacterium]|nr:MFS transporter [Anaerolineales bacterium]MDW8227157.1 MFS transporter [Anaerolineales bacterium]
MTNLLRTYWKRICQFSPNARLYLLSAMIGGAAFGVYRLLFNFYALSLNLDESIIGDIITINSLTALLLALPLGYLANALDRKLSLLLGGLLTSLSVLVTVIWPYKWLFYAMAVVMGAAQSLSAVTMAPFLLENSGVEERTYLFSWSQGLSMTASFVGNSVGGYLPTWIGRLQGVEATSSTAYAGALGVIGVVSLMALLPLLGLRPSLRPHEERSLFAPFRYAVQHMGLIAKLVLPMLITSLGAGLFMPFMNVFFRVKHLQPDHVIGNVLAWGALFMGLGLIIAPPIADRIGKIQLVVISQALSIPFLALLGFAPQFWMSALAHYLRLTLMNMGGPVYNAFVMEHVEPKSRVLVASLTSMVWNVGWAFSPYLSGRLQVQYGFDPVFFAVLVLYSISVFLYWAFFWKEKTALSDPVPAV